MFKYLEILLVVTFVLITGSFFFVSRQNNAVMASDEFRRLNEDGVQVLETRMQTYLQGMTGVAAFLSSSDHVSAKDFESYVASLNISELLPGISGIGFIAQVEDRDIPFFTERVRADGQPNYSVRKLTDSNLHYLVEFIYPLEQNAQALGLDVTFEPKRSNILELARDTGNVQLTHPIELVQHDKSQPGFLLLLPTYIAGEFAGWVYAPFIAENLISNLTSSQGVGYQLQVFDGAVPDQNSFIFGDPDTTTSDGKYRSVYDIHHFGRTWTLVFDSTPLFEQAYFSYQPLVILVFGLVASSFLLFMLHSMRVRREALQELAALRDKQVQARKEENQSVFENAIGSMLLLDANDKILFANQAAQNCFGYNQEEIKGLQFDSIAHEIDELGDGTHNATGLAKSGEALTLYIQRNEWLTAENKRRVTVIVRNMTAQAKMQRELEGTKNLYDMALQGAEIGVFDIDLVSKRSEVSETWCRIMGFESGCNGMDTQRDFLSRIHPDDRSILDEADRLCIEGQTERSIAEYRVNFGENQWRWMRSDAVAVERDKDGKGVRLIGTQSDVTELRHNRNALEASEQQFRRVLQAAPIGMAIMDNQGTFTGVNDALCLLFGKSEAELLNTSRLSDLLLKEDVEAIANDLRKIATDGTEATYTREHRFIHPDGTEKWGLLNISWFFDKNEESHFLIGQINDITDQKKLGRLKDEFVSTVSHELRTPLTSIKGALGLIAATGNRDMTPAQQRLIEIASSNASRLTDIVNDILDLEKISSGEVSFEMEDIDLRKIVESASEQMSPFAVTHDNSFYVDLAAKQLLVHADPGRTSQILNNLISNACKYSATDTEIMIKAERIGDSAIVYVQNTGSGVPDHFRSSIFKAFSQADSSDTRAKGGTGLGLNISRQIVERHGGQIGFESVPGGVTVFWFTIPIALEAVQPKSEILEFEPQFNRSKLTLLHIEDDYDFAEIIAEELRNYADIIHTASVAETRIKMGYHNFDIVIMDWSLPDGDSITLLDEIVEKHPSAKIIALSADEGRVRDSRLFANMTKGRSDLAAVVASVNRCQSLAS